MYNLPYTVVGVYPEDLTINTEADGLTYVEHVIAEYGPPQAAAIAQSMCPERKEAVVVAVFEGHIIDKLFDMGLASGADKYQD